MLKVRLKNCLHPLEKGTSIYAWGNCSFFFKELPSVYKNIDGDANFLIVI